MGYRSDVAIVLSKDAITIFNNALDKAEPEKAAMAKDLMNSADDIRTDTATGEQMWLWECIKWSSFYEDCGLVEQILNDLPFEEYLFCRIGEDYDDVERDGGLFENPFEIDIVRYINVTPKNN